MLFLIHHMCHVKVLYFVYCTFQLYIFLYYIVGISVDNKGRISLYRGICFLSVHMTINTLNLESSVTNLYPLPKTGPVKVTKYRQDCVCCA